MTDPSSCDRGKRRVAVVFLLEDKLEDTVGVPVEPHCEGALDILAFHDKAAFVALDDHEGLLASHAVLTDEHFDLLL